MTEGSWPRSSRRTRFVRTFWKKSTLCINERDQRGVKKVQNPKKEIGKRAIGNVPFLNDIISINLIDALVRKDLCAGIKIYLEKSEKKDGDPKGIQIVE